jgi:LysR family transcriptional regulator, regulator of abg operon
MTDLKSIQHFVAVFKRNSFKGGAEELGLTQSAMTKSIARLEDQLSLVLFNRTTRLVEPTDSARILYHRAEELLSAHEALLDEARLLATGEMGALRVGVIALAAETLVGPALASLASSHPQLNVEVVVGSADVYRDLALGACDLAIGDEANFLQSSHAATLRMRIIGEEAVVLVHRPGLVSGARNNLSKLLQYPLAIPSRYYNENRLFHSIAQHVDAGDARYRLNSLSACLNLAASSDVVTFLPQSFAEQARLQGAIVIPPVDLELTVRLVAVSRASHSQTPAVKAFHAALLAVRPNI